MNIKRYFLIQNGVFYLASFLGALVMAIAEPWLFWHNFIDYLVRLNVYPFFGDVFSIYNSDLGVVPWLCWSLVVLLGCNISYYLLFRLRRWLIPSLLILINVMFCGVRLVSFFFSQLG